jgi:hypothetical protein
MTKEERVKQWFLNKKADEKYKMNLTNKGALFEAQKDKEYKYSGVLTIDGNDFQLFVYEAESKKGQPYLQISAYPKRDLNGHTA